MSVASNIQEVLRMTNAWVSKRYEGVTGKTVTDFLTEYPRLRVLDTEINAAAQLGDVAKVKAACREYCTLWKTALETKS